MLSKLAIINIRKVLDKLNPLTKGMLTYGVLWPVGSLLQQTISGKRYDTYDYLQCLRYGIYGSLFVAPTLYCWIRLSSSMWPNTNFRTGITKAIVEQISYGPMASVSFFFGMSLLEMKSLAESRAEVADKFLPTFKIALCVWPIIQTINFSLIPERNRVPFVSVCSVLWTTFLAYIKQLEAEDLNKLNLNLKRNDDEKEQ